MKVAVIGQGYVGLTISIFAAQSYEVIGFDLNENLVLNLNQGISHIEGVKDKSLSEVLKLGRYKATSNPKDISTAKIVVIAVPTPLTLDRKPDLNPLLSACKIIGENLSVESLIINESTSYPGTLRNFIKPQIEKFSKLKLNHSYAISPERVDPGRIDFNQKNTPRIFSGLSITAANQTRNFYSKFCDNLIEVSTPEIAESAKLFENTFRQVNIALVNEFAQIAHAIGINVYETLDAANTKPYGFMKFTPSAGVGGHCIPVDPTYLATVAEENGVPAKFIRLANEVNLEMSRYVVGRVKNENGDSLRGKRILIIGIAYKPDVADVRESPAELIISHLIKEGAIVSWHDEVVANWKNEISAPLSGADIAIVVTKHSSVDELKILNSAPYVFDTTGKIKGASSI